MSDLVHQPTATGLRKAPKVRQSLAGADGISVLTSAISVAQMVLFAVGPEGAIAAAGLQVLELCFASGNQQPVNLPKEINDLVVQDFADDHVRTELATIVGYANWLSEQNGMAISGEMPDKQQKEYAGALKELSDYVVVAAGPNSNLADAISRLRNGTYPSDPPFSVLGLPAFLLGAFLYLAFKKANLLFSTDATTFKSPLVYDIVNTATDYLRYIDEVGTTISKTLDDRIRAIAPPVAGEFMEFAGERAVAHPYVYIVDHAAGQFLPQEIKKPSTGGAGGGWGYPDDIVWYSVCGSKGVFDRPHCDDSDIGQGGAWRNNYIIAVEAGFREKWNYDLDRQAELAACRAKLVEIIERYRAAAPARQG